MILSFPRTAHAGEVGARITQAVTTSELGLSVRRSVVRGAQIVDKLDGSWERFSDDYGLGTERNKRDARPKPKVIPPLLPLDTAVTAALLTAADAAFLTSMSDVTTTVTPQRLQAKITHIDGLVRKSFERSGVSLSAELTTTTTTPSTLTAPEYNFLCYAHFRAYNELLVENKVNFNVFRKRFEVVMGDAFVDVLLPEYGKTTTSSTTNSSGDNKPTARLKKDRLLACFTSIGKILDRSRAVGLIALGDQSDSDDERLTDWSNDLGDYQLSVSLDGDATLSAQILLQEQGFRLYPDLTRFGITSLLKRELAGVNQVVTSDEYYMDPSYSTDPKLFEVKEVLLNIVIESK